MNRVLLGIVLVGLLAYAAVCVLVYSRQRDLVYYGAATRADAATTDFALRRDGGVVLRGWVSNPGRRDVLLFFGGNAEAVQYARDEFEAWVPGRTGYFVAYRGYGASTGEPSQDAILADALALHDDVVARHPGARVALVGRSLGSGVAAHVAAHRSADRLVLVTPYDSLAAVASHHYPWLPIRWLATERYDSATALRGYRGDVMVVRAGGDGVIPPASTDRLLDVLPDAHVVAVADAGHDLPLATPEVSSALARFLAPAPDAR